ncbi:hypothetical protein ASG06_06905 [Rathayibacter sp. Leaf185]|nr:hypothetical protein ASF42_06905 [Rathayibacter sp. Leaf294]KQS14090.1 hypothetical protein ASG06_06905 [Rathayibacter sp. Leaf185]
MDDMMKAMPMTGGATMDMTAMQACIDACSACMQACTMCSDAMSGREGMGRCASMCASCADMCTTMMRMLMRPMGMDPMTMRPMLEACIAMCRACMEECAGHAEMSETCRLSAMACEDCMKACEAMLASMATA